MKRESFYLCAVILGMLCCNSIVYASGYESIYTKISYKNLFSYESLSQLNTETPRLSQSMAYDGQGGNFKAYIPGGTISTDITISSPAYADGSVRYWVGSYQPSSSSGQFWDGSSYRTQSFSTERLVNIRIPGPSLNTLAAQRGYWINFSITGFVSYSVAQSYVLNLDDKSEGYTYHEWYDSIGNSWQTSGDPPLDNTVNPHPDPDPEPDELIIKDISYTAHIDNPSEISFISSVSGGKGPYTYAWSTTTADPIQFLNGTGSTSQNPTIKFSNNSVTIQLKVTDSTGKSVSSNIENGIIIQPGNSGEDSFVDIKKVNCAVPDIYSPLEVKMMPLIEISGIEPDELTYEWKYSDGKSLSFAEGTSSSSSPVVSFPRTGNYMLSLSIKQNGSDINDSYIFQIPLSTMSVEASRVSLSIDDNASNSAVINVYNAIGEIKATVKDTAVATCAITGSQITVTGKSQGFTYITVSDSISKREISVIVGTESPLALPKTPSVKQYEGEKSLAPVYLGSISSGGSEFELTVNFSQYSESVDHYIVLMMPDGGLYFVADEEGSGEPLIKDEIMVFAENKTERVIQNIFAKDNACSFFDGEPNYPEGEWGVYWLTCKSGTNLVELFSGSASTAGYEMGYYSFKFSCPDR